MENPHKQPVAIVTGGSGYVGAAIASALLARGWRVVVASRAPKAPAGAESIACDITDDKAVARMVGEAVKRYGSIHACVHAAAPPTTRMSLLTITPEAFDTEFAVAVRGAFLLSRHAAAHLTPGAAFIGITTRSLETEKTEGRIGVYLPAKQSLRTLLAVLASELLEKKVRVYAVAPGVLPGGLNQSLPEPVRNLLARQLDGTTASADQVGELVADLCTKPDAYPSGTSITTPDRTVTPL